MNEDHPFGLPVVMKPSGRPVRVAVMDEGRRGIAAMLQPFDDRVEVVQHRPGQRVPQDVDVVLYHSHGLPEPARLVAALESALNEVEQEWPGAAAGLTRRESDVVELIGRGLTNQQIALECHVTINSVKTYIRTAYRKMGVTSRTQALLWSLHHGFHPDLDEETSAQAG